MFSKRLLAVVATAWLQWAAAHPHHGIDELPALSYVAPQLTRAFEAAWRLSAESVQSEGLLLRAEAEKDVASGLLAGAPGVQLDHREARASGSSTGRESEAALHLPLWLPGQRGARGAAADAEAAVAEAALHAARLRIAGEVREAAWQLFGAEGEVVASRNRLAGAQELAADVDRRVSAGDLPRVDSIAAKAETFAARSVLSEAEQRSNAARSRWGVLTGLSSIVDPGEAEPVARTLDDHPLRVHARAAIARAQRQLDYVKASRRDPPELSVKFRRETLDANLPAENSVGLGIRIPLGTAARNSPRDAEAVAALENARAEERRTVARLEADERAARASLESARQRLASEESRRSLLLERSQLIHKSFSAGETPLPEVLRAREAAVLADAAYERQRAELGLARARVLQALGVLP